ncbi:MAG: hypothetical protein KDA74_10960 [Planctomycetaceae bacterium]|nr:hypothetical protein [Planctomycetaceae bacterium]
MRKRSSTVRFVSPVINVLLLITSLSMGGVYQLSAISKLFDIVLGG